MAVRDAIPDIAPVGETLTPEPQDYELSEHDLVRLIDEEIVGSISFENDPEDDRRDKALEYHRGEMADLPSAEGWSSAVSKDLSDTIDFMLPGLMRVFSGAGQIVRYDPRTPKDVQSSEQATDYVNHVWENECDGYRVLYTGIHDALLVRNGVFKTYWDQTPEYDQQELTGLTEDQLTFLSMDPEVEIVGVREGEQIIQDPMTGQSIPIPVYDLKIKRVTSNGRLRIEVVPPEDFGLSSRAKTIEDAACVWHRSRFTRSDLIKQGFPADVVDDLPSWTHSPADRVNRNWDITLEAKAPQRQMEEIEVYECYCLYDVNGDGVAERIKVLVAGGKGGRKILPAPDGSLYEEWPDEDLPFSDIVAKPVPHRWQGHSIADDVMDVQRVKTALTRSLLDNLYLVNRPQRGIQENQIVNPDEVLNPAIGGVFRTKGPPQAAIADFTPSFVGDKALMGLQHFDAVIRKRTGVAESTSALDSTALEPQTATAEQIQHDASYSKIELVARNMAELGLKKLFRKILRIVVKNQDRTRMIRLRDQFVEMDPRSWNAAMDVTINVGLGTGSRERDQALLRGIGAEQDKVVAQLGPDNPIVPPEMWVETRHKMLEVAGIKTPGLFFRDMQEGEFAAWNQQRQQGQADPKAQELQAKMQLEQAKLQANMQLEEHKIRLEAMKAQADAELRRQQQVYELERQAMIEARQAEADVVVQQQKSQAQMAMEAQKFEFDKELKILDLQTRQLERQFATEDKVRQSTDGQQERSGRSDGFKAIAEAMKQPKKIQIDQGNDLQAIAAAMTQPRTVKIDQGDDMKVVADAIRQPKTVRIQGDGKSDEDK
jgi:hypothetical protein